MSKVIAIDVGAAKFRQSVEVDGRIVVLPNEQDKRSTPTCLSYKNGELHVGKVDSDPKRNLCGAKRFVGRTVDQLSTFHKLASFPRQISSDDSEALLFKLGTRDDYKTFSAPETLAHVLDKARTNAESKLGAPATDAVLTVPSFFGHAQRQAIAHAGQVAGLNVVRLINESSAVAVAFASTLESDVERLVFVLDIGASKVDLCLARMAKHSVKVLAHYGSEECGGEEFTHRLVKHVAEGIENECNGEDVRASAKVVKKIAEACNKDKETLSSTGNCRIVLEDLSDDIEEYETEVSRELFEKLCADIFGKIARSVRQLLAACHVEPRAVDDILLVGGSSRIPAIQSSVSEIFAGKWINTTLNVDEAIVTGAAHLAASMCPSSVNYGQLALEDTLAYGITIETGGQVWSVCETGAALPIRKSFRVSPTSSSDVVLKVSEQDSGVSRPIGTYSIKSAENSTAVDQFNVDVAVDMSGLVRASISKRCDDASLAVQPNLSLATPKGELTIKLCDGQLCKIDGKLVIPASRLPTNDESPQWLDVELHSRTSWCLLWSKDAVLAATSVFVPDTVRPATSLVVSVTKDDGGMLVKAAFVRAAPELRFEPARPSLTESNLDLLVARFVALKESELQRIADARARNELHQLHSDLCKMATPQFQALISQLKWDRLLNDLGCVKAMMDDEYRGIRGDDHLSKCRDEMARVMTQPRNVRGASVGNRRDRTTMNTRSAEDGTTGTGRSQESNFERHAPSQDKATKNGNYRN